MIFSTIDNRWNTMSISVNDGPVTVSKPTGNGDVVLYVDDEEVDRQTLGPKDTFTIVLSGGKASLMVTRKTG